VLRSVCPAVCKAERDVHASTADFGSLVRRMQTKKKKGNPTLHGNTISTSVLAQAHVGRRKVADISFEFSLPPFLIVGVKDSDDISSLQVAEKGNSSKKGNE
jgi:hypothetical protein